MQIGNRLAQSGQAAGIEIESLAVFQRRDGGVADEFWRGEIGLAQPERDQAIDAPAQIEDAGEAGWLQGGNVGANGGHEAAFSMGPDLVYWRP